ncbi:hypothetical protein BJX68DRAFT_247170 [Aspergillus pseudodeflectus]|uniref:Uncharacterized protein n=1 Tax=Aspergillus pseudodeflectus TaxID=176178 RepID=A0ABR4JIZ4_9EURO
MGIVSLVVPAPGIVVESKAAIFVLTRASSETPNWSPLFKLPKPISGTISRSRKRKVVEAPIGGTPALPGIFPCLPTPYT